MRKIHYPPRKPFPFQSVPDIFEQLCWSSAHGILELFTEQAGVLNTRVFSFWVFHFLHFGRSLIKKQQTIVRHLGPSIIWCCLGGDFIAVFILFDSNTGKELKLACSLLWKWLISSGICPFGIVVEEVGVY